jgi:ABC-type polysaccharide/polyol phosphate export permease
MFAEIRELLRYKDLVKQLVKRDLKIRYKNSVLGFFWSLLNPLIQVATITIVVKYILGLEIANYSAYLLAAYLPWAFFQMALLDSSQILIAHRDLLRKVYFPREALPLSAVLSNLVHFALALVVFLRLYNLLYTSHFTRKRDLSYCLMASYFDLVTDLAAYRVDLHSILPECFL